jgi:Flp pilus assembly pilin Flp
MWRVASKIRPCLASEDGPTAAEYAVMAVFIIVVSIGIGTAIGSSMDASFSSVKSRKSS